MCRDIYGENSKALAYLRPVKEVMQIPELLSNSSFFLLLVKLSGKHALNPDQTRKQVIANFGLR